MSNRLAIDGGTPVRTAPLPPWPAPDEEMAQIAADVVRSGKLNYWVGEHGRSFEHEYADATGRTHAVAVANGTLALELALRAFHIGPGDDVIVPSRTFIATASAVVAVGARPIVAEINADSGNLTASSVRDALTDATRAVIPVHLGGWPVEIDPLLELAHAHNLVVIEDCAQAHGGYYKGRPVGGLGSHAAAFSFCQDKIVPLGEGGMLVLDDDDAYERAWAYKDHGKSLTKVMSLSLAENGTSFRWLVDSFGSNWRPGEVASAIGRIGLRRLPSWPDARRRNALRLANGPADLRGLRIPLPPDAVVHAFYRLYSFVDPEALVSGWDRDRIARSIASEGVPCQYGTCAEIYREGAFADAGLAPAIRFPNASRADETTLAFFVHPTLGDGDIDDFISAVRKVMEVAAR